MGWEQIPRCETCRALKKEANRWFVVRLEVFDDEGLHIIVQPMAGSASASNPLTFCGIPCFLQAIQKQMESKGRERSKS